MLTRCPHCQSWFRVRAEQLSVANGRVTCGTCDRVFSALATLVDDEPAAAPRLDAPAPPVREPAAPAAAVPDANVPRTVAADTAAVEGTATGTPEAEAPETEVPETEVPETEVPETEVPETEVPEAEVPEAEVPEAEVPEAEVPEVEVPEVEVPEVEVPEVEVPEAGVREVEVPEAGVREVAERRTAASPGGEPGGTRGSALEDDVPALLREEYAALAHAQARRPRRRPWWAVACVLLGLTLVLQLALVERAALAAAVPAVAPWLERLCARLPCPPHAGDGSGGVRLLARDVREHPQYEDALLVNATLVNDGATSAPFPIIELVLHDAGGRAVGARRFDPAEYLDHSMPVAAGMPPRQPVYVVIELAGPDAAATSFEFRFL